MPVLASAAAATSDDAMLAWAIKHGTAGKRRDIAGSIGVTYPAAAAFLGTTCDRGHGYAGVWVVNFANTPARWNVTLDGVGYAGAQVRPASHDYGAPGVPDGRHTLAFVDPRTGAVAAKIATDLHCGTPAGGTPTSGWSPTGPVEDGSIPATHPSSTPPPPARRPSQTPPGVGPVVETDHVSSDRDPGALVVSFPGAAGALLSATRRLRRAR